MNLCNFCVKFSKKPRCCTDRRLKNYLGIVFPTGVSVFHCDFFESSKLNADVVIDVHGSKVMYKETIYKPKKPKFIYVTEK